MLHLFVQLLLSLRLVAADVSSLESPMAQPFYQVWAIGVVADKIELVTSAHTLFIVNSRILPGDGTLPLSNATALSLEDMLDLSGIPELAGIAQARLEQGIFINHQGGLFAKKQPLLHFSVVDDNGTLQNYIAKLDDSRIDSITWFGQWNRSSPDVSAERVWLSSTEANVFFQVLRKQVAHSLASISLAKYKLNWRKDIDGFVPDSVQNLTGWYTICMKAPGRHEQSIFMTEGHCSYPVQWEIVSGFADSQYFYLLGNDQVYLFEEFLFFLPGVSGHFVQRDFTEFFWNKAGGSGNRRNSIFAQAVLTFLIISAGVFLLTAIGLFLMHYEYNSCEAEKKSERTMRDESRLKDVSKEKEGLNKTKVVSRKRESDATMLKMTSALLPSAHQSQKMSIKTNWSEEGKGNGPDGQAKSSSSKKKTNKSTSKAKSGCHGKSKSRGKVKRGAGEQLGSSANWMASSQVRSQKRAKKTARRSATATRKEHSKSRGK